MNTAAHPTIMLVDDDADLLGLLRSTLEKEGYTIDARTSAPRRQDIADVRPSMIFMDIGLSEENGAALCRAIKDDFGAALPIILISGMEEGTLKREADSCHADGYISKPVNPRLLLTLARHYTTTN